MKKLRKKTVVRKSRLSKGGNRRGAGRPSSNEADVHVNCRYSRPQIAAFNRLCAVHRFTRTDALRMAMAQWIDGYTKHKV